MKNLILLTLLFSLSATTYSCAQTKLTQKEKFQSTYNVLKAMVKSKAYTFVGEVVYTNKNRESLQDGTNSISLTNARASGLIMSLNKSDTFKIDGKVENYKASFDDEKQQIAIEFKVNEIWCYLDIKPNGNSFLAIKSKGKTVTQTGKLKTL